MMVPNSCLASRALRMAFMKVPVVLLAAAESRLPTLSTSYMQSLTSTEMVSFDVCSKIILKILLMSVLLVLPTCIDCGLRLSTKLSRAFLNCELVVTYPFMLPEFSMYILTTGLDVFVVTVSAGRKCPLSISWVPPRPMNKTVTTTKSATISNASNFLIIRFLLNVRSDLLFFGKMFCLPSLLFGNWLQI